MEKIAVEIKRIIVLLEGYSSVKSLIEKIPNNGYSTLIVEIGFNEIRFLCRLAFFIQY